MWKWLHRGLIALLLLISAGSLTLSTINLSRETQYKQINIVGKIFDEEDWLIVAIGGPSLQVAAGIWTEPSSEKLDAIRSYNKSIFGSLKYSRRSYGYPGSRWVIRRHRSNPATAWRTEHSYFLSVPTWFLAFLTAIYPAVFFIRTHRRRRVRRAALKPCDKCGYDLQGNVSGVCPECGEAAGVAA